MPNAKPYVRSLFGEDNDTFVRAHPKNRDDRSVDRQRRGSKKGRLPPVPPTGPACGRCVSWRRPLERDSYGTCNQIGVAVERNPFWRVEKGDVASIADFMSMRIAFDDLRTAPGAMCSGFTEIGLEDAA